MTNFSNDDWKEILYFLQMTTEIDDRAMSDVEPTSDDVSDNEFQMVLPYGRSGAFNGEVK